MDKNEGSQVALQFALVDVGACEFFGGKQAGCFDGDEAARILVGDGDGGEFVGVEAGFPGETAAGGVDLLIGGEGDGAGAGGHFQVAGFGGVNGTDLTRGWFAVWEKEGAEESE